MNKEDLKDFVLANPHLVTRKESTTYPGLYVLKYSRRVFFDSLWNDILEECRGLVVDEDWNIVVHPFTKIYNHGERDTTMPDLEPVVAVEKVNGFMAALTFINKQPIVSTTGSLDSPYVEMAKEKLEPFIDMFPKFPHLTYIFEIVHENDPHIIKEDVGAYLIGARNIVVGYMMNEDSLDEIAMGIGLRRPNWILTEFWNAVNLSKIVKHEGFVIRSQNPDNYDFTLKIKSPYYLALKAAARKKDIESLDKSRVDEEFYDLIGYIKENKETFNVMEEQERLEFMKEFLCR